jgi:hypothetical protein
MIFDVVPDLIRRVFDDVDVLRRIAVSRFRLYPIGLRKAHSETQQEYDQDLKRSFHIVFLLRIFIPTKV